MSQAHTELRYIPPYYFSRWIEGSTYSFLRRFARLAELTAGRWRVIRAHAPFPPTVTTPPAPLTFGAHYQRSRAALR